MEISNKVRSGFLISCLFIISACNSIGLTSLPEVTPVETQPDVAFVQATATATVVIATSVVGQAEIGLDRAVENGLPLVARVNGEPVFLEAYQQQILAFEQLFRDQGVNFDSEDRQVLMDEMQQQVLQGLVDQRIIEQYAEKMGLTVVEDELEDKVKEAVTQPVTQEQFESWLAENNLNYQQFTGNLKSQLIANKVFDRVTRNMPITAEQIRLQYVRLDSEAEAREIVEQLGQGKNFTQLVQEQIENEQQFGFLDWFPRQANLIPAEVEAVAFSLQPGEISGPIETPAGFYIIKLEGRDLDYPLANEVLQGLKNQIFSDWLKDQRASTIIERFAAPQ